MPGPQFCTHECQVRSSVLGALGKVAYSGIKGGVIGGANAVPIVGATGAAYGFDLAEQVVGGASLDEAREHANAVAGVTALTSGIAFVAPLPDVNAVEGAVVAAVEATYSDALTGIDADLGPAIELTEQDARAIKDKIEQTEALKKEGEVGPGQKKQ